MAGAAGEAGAGNGGTGDVAGDTGGGGTAGAGAGGGTTGLGGTPADGGVDVGNHCELPADCAGKPAALACNLATNACVECTADSSTCSGAKPACATNNTCVECVVNGDCGGAKPACNKTTNRCLECVVDGDCPTAEKAFCSKDNVCVGCSSASTNACMVRDTTKPVCAASGACVACDTDANCHDPTLPFCGGQKTCVSCGQAPQSFCGGLNGAKPVCGASGACVECGKDGDCSPTSTTPFCSAAGSCVGCGVAHGTSTCTTLVSSKPNCGPSGACVECAASTDCPNAKPVCSSAYSCGACSADSDCSTRGPGVCMSHLDGRCASNSETIYVQNNVSCSDSGGTAGGTTAAPFCSMQPATAIVSGSRDLIVVRGNVAGASSAFASAVSIVGQSGAAILGSVYPALHVSGGTTYARDLRLSSSGSMGLQADSGSTVQLEHLQVTQNATGGIQLDGAAFNIHNTAVTDNNTGTFNNLTAWAGILVNNPPASGAKSLQLVTVQNNKGPGITCSTTIAAGASGVLATGNTTADILSCGFTSCSAASSTCGAQP